MQSDPSSPLPPDIPPEVHERRWYILAVLCAGLILVIAANAGLNVGLPAIADDLGASQTQLQWLVDTFILTLSGLLLPMGAIGDRFGRRRMFLIGLAIYAIVSAGAAFAYSITQLLMIRALMGVGAAMILPNSLSLITTAFSGRERVLAIAIWSGFAGGGAGIGLMTSGILLLWFKWNAMFLVNVPLSAIAFIGGLIYLVEAKDRQARPVDLLGSAIVMVALWTLLFAIIELPIHGLTSPVILGSFLGSAILWGLFVLRLKRSPTPLLDWEWFKDPRFFLGATSIALLFFALTGWFFLSPQYTQFIHHFSSFEAALVAVIVSITQVVFAHKAAFWVDRLGITKTVVLGLGLVATGTGIASLLPLSHPPLWPFLIAQILIGLGLPWASSPATSAVIDALPPDRVGAGSAVNGTVRQIGAALGIAITGTALTSVYRAALPVDGLDPQVRAAAQQSVTHAQAIADTLPDPVAFMDGVALAYAKGFQVAMITNTAFILAAIVLVLAIGFRPPRPFSTSVAT